VPRAHYRDGVIIGLDVGGTKALGLLIDPDDVRIVARARRPSAGSGEHLVETLAGIVTELEAQAKQRIEAVGLGIAGLVNRDGTVRYSPNLPDLVEFPVTARLAARCGRSVTGTNDATAGTWAEAVLGAGRGTADFAYVALGTGIGAGFVVNGRLVLGANGFAGEVGHMVVDAGGPAHITGQRGPWEYFASGTALGRLGREAAAAGRFPAARSATEGSERVTGHHVVALMREGDNDAMAVFDEFCREVARGITNIVMTLDPECIALGGGLVDVGEPLRAGVDHWIGALLVGAEHRPPPRIVLAELGSDAAALGAALLASDAALGTRP
jgi:glucokinase